MDIATEIQYQVEAMIVIVKAMALAGLGYLALVIAIRLLIGFVAGRSISQS